MKRHWFPKMAPVGLAVVLISLGIMLSPYFLQFYHNALAGTNLRAGRPAAAAGHLEWLFKQSPDDTGLCLRLTDAYLADGNTARAEYTLGRGLNAGAEPLALHQKLCAVYLLQDKVLDAVNYLDGLSDPQIKEQLDALRPAAPVFSPPPGRYEEDGTLEATVPEGADCYLSTDGQVPSLKTDAYSEPRALPVGVTTLRAVAVKDGLVSTWSEGVYRLENIVQPVAFADHTMESLLREMIDNPDQPVMSSDLWVVTELTPDTEPVHYTSLADLAYLQGLTTLSLYGDGTKLDIAPLAALTQLKKLSLRRFALDESDLEMIAQWTWLEELNLSDNRIEGLDAVAGLTGLTALNLKNNNISDAKPLRELTGLTRLELSQNALADTAPLAALSALSELSLSENKLRDIGGLRTLTQLVWLDISYNEITDLSPLSGHRQLTTLLCKACPLQSLASLAECRALEILSCTGGEIQSVSELAGLTGLRELCLDNNKLETLSGLASCTELEKLLVNGNRLTALDELSGLSKLTLFAAQENQITSLDALKQCPALRDIYAFGNPLEETVDKLGNATVHNDREY